MKSIFSIFKDVLSNQGIRHLLMNYSMSSHGARHPEGPVGWILRDEGQVDIYAAKTKLILGVNGELLSIARNAHHIAERTNFTVRGISNFRILGKYFSKDLFEGQKVLAVKPKVTLSAYSVIGPDTQVINSDGSTGKIVNTIPLQTIFDERMIFETDIEDKNLLPSSVLVMNLVKSFMR
jgi:hypothetical protein